MVFFEQKVKFVHQKTDVGVPLPEDRCVINFCRDLMGQIFEKILGGGGQSINLVLRKVVLNISQIGIGDKVNSRKA